MAAKMKMHGDVLRYSCIINIANALILITTLVLKIVFLADLYTAIQTAGAAADDEKNKTTIPPLFMQPNSTTTTMAITPTTIVSSDLMRIKTNVAAAMAEPAIEAVWVLLLLLAAFHQFTGRGMRKVLVDHWMVWLLKAGYFGCGVLVGIFSIVGLVATTQTLEKMQAEGEGGVDAAIASASSFIAADARLEGRVRACIALFSLSLCFAAGASLGAFMSFGGLSPNDDDDGPHELEIIATFWPLAVIISPIAVIVAVVACVVVAVEAVSSRCFADKSKSPAASSAATPALAPTPPPPPPIPQKSTPYDIASPALEGL